MKLVRLTVLVSFLASGLLPGAFAQVSVTTQHNDNSRTGQNINETVLTPASVNMSTFGRLFVRHVEGQVYAQPLYLSNVNIPGKGRHNVVYVATEHDILYAFDADRNTGGNTLPLWERSFIDPAHGIHPVSSGDTGCSDLTPEIGITGTPVIDSATGTLYVLVKTKENGRFVQRLHAVDVGTGAEKFGGPVVIKGRAPGTGDGAVGGFVFFDPLREGQRQGLLLQNGAVYIAWASHCDIGPYHGWVISYDAATLAQTGIWNATPNGGLGGFWAGGAGLAADSSFNTFVVTGNGTFDLDRHGNDFGDSIIRLSPPAGGLFKVADFFTPFDQQDLSDEDADLGSGGVMLLPDQTGLHPHLLVQAGKEGTVYLIDRDSMGRFNPNSNNQIVQSLTSAVGGVWGMPAWWNNNVYFGGTGDFLKMFTFNTAVGRIVPNPASESPTVFGYPGPTPSISANGNSNAIAWVLQTDGSNNGSATLRAYDATDLSKELYNSAQNPNRDDAGAAVKFTVPTIANGKVFVPAINRLTVYGLLSGEQGINSENK